MTIEIHSETAGERQGIREVHLAAFDTGAEADLVDNLRAGGYVERSLVAVRSGVVVGHILFSRLPLLTESGQLVTLSLAPMAVLPSHQRQGIGSQLVEAGLVACGETGYTIAIVLGHPDFYPRFGFSARLAQPLDSPFGGGEAWMARELVPGALQGVAGRVQFPPPFAVFD